MTSKSRLSHRLELCQLVKQLDNDGCASVIRSIHHELGYSSLNTLLMSMVMHLSDTTPSDSLIKMKNTINDIITAKNTHNDPNNNVYDKQKKQQQMGKLLRLPIDLISKTSLYLNEKDIFNFEKCCKLFYHTVNNLSFINQSNTFKTFRLTSKRLRQMTQPQHNFYKYSKASELAIESFTTPCGGQVETQFDKAITVGNYDRWIETMFKSIETLKIETFGLELLPKLPIDILFDPDPIKSNLKTFDVTCICTDEYQKLKESINKFYEKYIYLKKEFKNQGKKIRVLKCFQPLVFSDTMMTNSVDKLFCIESKHTCMFAFGLPVKHLLEHNFGFCDDNNNASLETLTLECCQFDPIDRTKINSNTINSNQQLQCHGQIKTLRFIRLGLHSNTDILENTKLIESLNFHNSVKNLTLNCTLDQTDDCDNWTKIISNLLAKKDYFNLDNLNILLQFSSLHLNEELVNWIFEILKRNQQLLKHQFNQLNIGFRIEWISHDTFYVLRWNPKIDEKFLNHLQQQCNQSYKQASTKGEAKSFKEKYYSAMEQWAG